MSDFFRDPAFPDRPQHADFWRMVDVVNEHDGRAGEGREDVDQILAGYVDEASLVYMAEQRMLRLGLGRAHPHFIQILGLYIDAFVMGAGYQQRGGHRDG